MDGDGLVVLCVVLVVLVVPRVEELSAEDDDSCFQEDVGNSFDLLILNTMS